MHPNPVFDTKDAQANLAFARDRAFGVLAVTVADAPVLSHIPFLLSGDGAVAELHLVHSNPIARALVQPLRAVLVMSGPDGWYGVEDQVPTWNYVAVHLRGTLELRPRSGLRDLLDRQSAFFEDRLRPKTPWTTQKMTPEVRDRMMRQIVPCAFIIEAVSGTWKLGQNKPDAVRLNAAHQVDAAGIGAETALLAALMRGVDEE